MSSFLSKHVFQRKLDFRNLLILNGCGSILSALSYVICDPGDVILVPSPCYYGFFPDFEILPQAKFEVVPFSSDDDFNFSFDVLEKVYHSVLERGKNVRALLFCSP
jgi:1-aminocyclopropane-1-carboxylate synthase